MGKMLMSFPAQYSDNITSVKSCSNTRFSSLRGYAIRFRGRIRLVHFTTLSIMCKNEE